MRSLTLIEHKKHLLKLLKRHLPGLKMSAQTSRFANGTSIHLSPKPGFLIGDLGITRMLHSALSSTAYSRFDGMDDSTFVVRHTIQDPETGISETVSMGSKFVSFRDNIIGVPVVITEADVNAMLSDPEWPRVVTQS